MKKLIIIRIKFNVPYHVFSDPFQEERLTKSWIDYRMSIFMKYTCQSLINQTNSSFIALIYYDPVSEALIQEALSHYAPLPKNIIFTSNIEEMINNYAKGYDHLILTYLDSDNMFHPTMIERLYQVDTAKYQVIFALSGYALDIRTNTLGYYYYPYPDTFYSLIYNASDYLNGIRLNTSMTIYQELSSPDLTFKSLPNICFSEPLFIILIHDKVMTHEISRMLKIGTIRFLIESAEEKSNILSSFMLN